MAKRILVADDSAAIRQSISYILSQAGYEVQDAADGEEALEKLSRGPKADLVISDVNMPRIDGIELIRRLRALPDYRFTPILVLTTDTQGSQMQEGRRAGATGWIIKPFNADKLLGIVEKVID